MEINLLKGKELLLTPPGVKKVNGQKPAQCGNVSIDLQSVTEEGATTTLPITAGPAELDSQLATLAQAKAEAQKFLAEIHTLINALDTSNDAEHAVFAQKIEALQLVVDSDDTTLDTIQEIVAFIKANKNVIDAISTSKLDKVTFETWVAGTFEPFVTQFAAHHHDDRYCKLDDLRLADERFPLDHYHVPGYGIYRAAIPSDFAPFEGVGMATTTGKYLGSKRVVFFPYTDFLAGSTWYQVHIGPDTFAGTDVEVVVLGCVSSLNMYAFRNAKKLKTVIIDVLFHYEESILIPPYCFSGCTSLQQVIILRDRMIRISKGAFYNCINLIIDFKFTLTDSVDSRFSGLEDISIPVLTMSGYDVQRLNEEIMTGVFERSNVKTLILKNFYDLPTINDMYSKDISVSGIMPSTEIIIDQNVSLGRLLKFKHDFPTYTKVSCPKLDSSWIDAEISFVGQTEAYAVINNPVQYRALSDRIEFRGELEIVRSNGEKGISDLIINNIPRPFSLKRKYILLWMRNNTGQQSTANIEVNWRSDGPFCIKFISAPTSDTAIFSIDDLSVFY